MAKLPSFQFYPGDWSKDPNLRRCSFAAKGVLMDLLCIMFDCEQRGKLITNGVAWSDDDIVEAVGRGSRPLLQELINKGVLHREKNTGVVYSRRMVRDEEQRQEWREKKRGQRDCPSFVPALSHDCPAVVPDLSPPSSSSSSSSSSKEAAAQAQTGADAASDFSEPGWKLPELRPEASRWAEAILRSKGLVEPPLREIARIVLQSAGVDDVGIEDIQRIGAPERIVVRCAIDAAYDGKRMTRCRNPGGATVRRFREKLAECRRTA